MIYCENSQFLAIRSSQMNVPLEKEVTYQKRVVDEKNNHIRSGKRWITGEGNRRLQRKAEFERWKIEHAIQTENSFV